MTAINKISNHIMGYFNGTLDAFEQYVIEFINSHWDEHHPLKELNPYLRYPNQEINNNHLHSVPNRN